MGITSLHGLAQKNLPGRLTPAQARAESALRHLHSYGSLSSTSSSTTAAQGKNTKNTKINNIKNNSSTPCSQKDGTKSSSSQSHDSLLVAVPNVLYAYEKQCEFAANKLNIIRDNNLPQLQQL